MESFHRRILQEGKKDFMTQTGEPNSIHECPVLIMQLDRSKMKDISIRTLIKWEQRQNSPKQNETKQKSQQIFLIMIKCWQH